MKDREVRYPIDRMSGSSEAASVLRTYLEDQDCEHLVVLMLDGSTNMIGLHEVAMGGISGCSVSCRDIFKAAIVARASALILSHNHPSGDVSPSREDTAFTKQAIKIGKMLGVAVLDHIIISSGISPRHLSFQAAGLMDQLNDEADTCK